MAAMDRTVEVSSFGGDGRWAIRARDTVTRVALVSLRLSFMQTRDRLQAALREVGTEAPAGMQVVAIGWATVDRERAALEWQPLAFRPAPDDETLGAYVWRARLDDGTALLLLEPSTEGRLAAALARRGEGPVAIWVAGRPPRGDLLAAASALGGRSWLARPAHPWGPFLLYHQAMESESTIRDATDADAEAIAGLFTDEGYPAGPSDIRERLGRFASRFSTVKVAEIGGEVVGFVAVHVLPRFEHGDRVARVLALVVDPGVRERGIGHELMAAAEAVGHDTDCAYVEVTAGRHRPEALHLYEALGYEPGVAAYLRKRL
jgi:ribosomal protein S18 acetylase RimI-like enzyme